MQDVQNHQANREIDINRVGVTDIKYPLRVREKTGGFQSTIAELTLSVSLPKEFKGTHMSRFMVILQKFKVIDVKFMDEILREIIGALDAEFSYIKIEFPYFLRKEAPISYELGLMDYNCAFIACRSTDYQEIALSVSVPVTSVCPCSKAISDRGAHNQRGIIETKACISNRKEVLWIEDIISMAEESASCPVWPVLKRPDEKWVTEKAFDNPVFVEDIVREMAHKLKNIGVDPFIVKATNQESIHNHSAYAKVVEGSFRLL